MAGITVTLCDPIWQVTSRWGSHEKLYQPLPFFTYGRALPAGLKREGREKGKWKEGERGKEKGRTPTMSEAR